MLEHDHDDPPRRPRMCPTCQKLRNVEGATGDLEEMRERHRQEDEREDDDRRE